MNIGLADYIRAETQTILMDWEAFAKTILNAGDMNKSGLRDHAREMLLAIADDLDSHQTEAERTEKSKGREPEHAGDSWAEIHGGDRQASGFSVVETVSEFRALRASVVSHWTKACPTIGAQQLEELTRFHEAIDQAVAESLEQYADVKEMETRLFGAILAASPDPMYVMDLHGRFLFANMATATLFGIRTETIVGKSAVDLGFSLASDFQRHIKDAVGTQSSYRGRFTHTFPSGEGDRFEYVIAPVVGPQQNTEATVCIFRDITHQALAEEQIWHNAHHDMLTGLPNRRLFLDRLEQQIKQAKRSNLPLSVLFMDLDGFKEVNDSYGHETGDRLLAEVAERLTACVRDEDTVARLGGDEFTMILSGVNQRKDAELVAQTIIDAIADRFSFEKSVIQIAISIGISFYPHDAISAIVLLEAADKAMYQAKKSGSSWMCYQDTYAKAAVFG